MEEEIFTFLRRGEEETGGEEVSTWMRKLMISESAWLSVTPLELIISEPGWRKGRVAFAFIVMLEKNLGVQVPGERNRWSVLLFGAQSALERASDSFAVGWRGLSRPSGCVHLGGSRVEAGWSQLGSNPSSATYCLTSVWPLASYLTSRSLFPCI